MLELYTDRLKLRSVTTLDWDNFFYTHSNEALNRFVRIPQSEQLIRAKFERILATNELLVGEWMLTLIEEVNTGKFVGFVGLHYLDELLGQAEVGYMLRDSAQGQGYATESLQALIDWACISLNIHKFTGYCVDQNVASGKVMEKCGFQLEGLLRHNCKIGDEWLDDKVYGLLAEDRIPHN